MFEKTEGAHGYVASRHSFAITDSPSGGTDSVVPPRSVSHLLRLDSMSARSAMFDRSRARLIDRVRRQAPYVCEMVRIAGKTGDEEPSDDAMRAARRQNADKRRTVAAQAAKKQTLRAKKPKPAAAAASPCCLRTPSSAPTLEGGGWGWR